MILGIDLCGTTHDAKEANYLTFLDYGDKYARAIPTKEELFSKWTGHDWVKMIMSYGFTREEAVEIDRTYGQVYATHEPSPLIPGAQELFARNPLVVTGARQNVVEIRYRAQGLERHFPRTHTGHDRKAPVLAAAMDGQPLVYVGDTEGDALAIAELRAMGKDAFFIGVTHPYGFGADAVRRFCAAHKDFSIEAGSLEDVPGLLKDF